jgi:tetratricopeptide (TPR) repeat protein
MYKEAAELFEKALKDCKDIWGENDREYVSVLEQAASFFYNIGLFDKSKEFDENIIAIRKRICGVKHIAYANALTNAGNRAEAQFDCDLAEKRYKETFPVIQELFGKDCLGCARILLDIGRTHSCRFQFSLAEDNYQQSYEILKRTDNLETSVGAELQSRRAFDYLQQDRYSQAMQCIQTKKSIAKTTDSIYDRMRSLEDEVTILLWLDEDDRAESVIMEGIELLKRSDKVISAQYILYCLVMSDVYTQRKQYDKALAWYREALKKADETPEEYKSTSGIIRHLGKIYEEMGNYSESEKIYSRIKKILENNPGNLDYSFAQSLLDLGRINLKMKKFDQAEPLLLESKKRTAEILPANHLNNGKVRTSLAELYLGKEDFAQAERYVREALDIYEKPLGDRDPKAIAEALELYSKILVASKQENKAQEIEAKLKQVRTEKRKLSIPLDAESSAKE